jgi:rubrerythrin
MSGLNAAEIAALEEALDDEYHAFTTYDQVIADFGNVRPFSNIRDAEARHIGALLGLFHRYGREPPANRWVGRVKRYASLAEACADAVRAELDNAALYDRLLAATTRADLLAVFGNLREASQERHLPAFRRCVARDAR